MVLQKPYRHWCEEEAEAETEDSLGEYTAVVQRSDDTDYTTGTKDTDPEDDSNADPGALRRTSLTPLPEGYGKTSTRRKRCSAPGDDLEDDRPARKAKKSRHATPPSSEDEEAPPPKKNKGRTPPSDSREDDNEPAQNRQKNRRR